MTEIQVHTAGTKVIIEDDRIGIQYPKEDKPRETYPITAGWLDSYRHCRVCGKVVDDVQFAFALWKHEAACCSTECFRRELVLKHACCEKAVMIPCVCVYAFMCPVHGERHCGSHD